MALIPGGGIPGGGGASSNTGCQEDEIQEIIKFSRGSQGWYYTPQSTEIAADVDYTGTKTYQPASISRGKIAQGPEGGKRTIELRCPRDLDVVQAYRGQPQPLPMGISIYQKFSADWNWSAVWVGRVLQVIFDAGGARIRCEPASISLKRLGLRRLYTRTCPHVLYGSECRATPAPDVRVVQQVIGRQVIFVTALPQPEIFAGGYVTRADGTQYMIESAAPYSTGAILMAYPVDFSPGESVTLYKGCDHTIETCDARFGNADNFGGFPWIPTKNPFKVSAF